MILAQDLTESEDRSEELDAADGNTRDDDELLMLGSACMGSVTSGHRPQSPKDTNETDIDAVDPSWESKHTAICTWFRLCQYR